MTKPVTVWKTNSTKNATAVLYSDASTLYSSTTAYSSSTVGQNELNKPTTVWTQA